MISFLNKSANKKESSFHGAVLPEVTGDVPNPGRGWYHIYTYRPGEGEGGDIPPAPFGEETLALVLIDIGGYRERPLGEDCLGQIGEILDAFAAGGKDILLRIVYDTQGKGMEHEPSFFSQVQQHMEQLAPVLVRHSRNILVAQGLFVGSWGEMHTSKFLTDRYLRELARSFILLTEGKVRLAVRKPVQYRIIQPEGDMGERRMGCFDDAIFASKTHLGTFGTQDIQNKETAGWKQPWRPREELVFLEKLAEHVPFGGEALQGEEEMTPEDTVERLNGLHVSYLNCVHGEAVLRKWRETMYVDGVSLYDYIGAHLGYRFVVESVLYKAKKRGQEKSLEISIRNSGFACAAEEIQLYLYMQTQEERGIPVECGLGKLGGGERLTLHIPLKDILPESGARLYAQLRRVRDEKTIVFANEPAGSRLLLGFFD